MLLARGSTCKRLSPKDGSSGAISPGAEALRAGEAGQRREGGELRQVGDQQWKKTPPQPSPAAQERAPPPGSAATLQSARPNGSAERSPGLSEAMPWEKKTSSPQGAL